eukprot:TRINITY_DN13327_c0_g1_i1.p5 TRINITY_DN13327_c0_g1~~TRINITY_DN13327_c0_g1_i1.p5  ORF type:complete len:101 (+),score=13.86 TRINITY_DN13327_c0_g1_i1:536-838(+)
MVCSSSEPHTAPPPAVTRPDPTDGQERERCGRRRQPCALAGCGLDGRKSAQTRREETAAAGAFLYAAACTRNGSVAVEREQTSQLTALPACLARTAASCR